MVQKREFVEIIFTNDIDGVTITLCNAHEVAHTTCLAMLEDTMANKLPEERFCSERISYLLRIKSHSKANFALSSYLLTLINLDKQLEHKLVGMAMQDYIIGVG